MIAIESVPKPVFLVTHPRAISTAFERIFLAREEDVLCVHEPFSDAYHWGPEKLSERYENVEALREDKGCQDYTYRAAFETVNEATAQGKLVFVKDMAKCLMPLHGDVPYIVPSLCPQGLANSGYPAPQERHMIQNPTVIPLDYLSRFHYAFLIRNPKDSIPSLYECSIPPKSFKTGWHGFRASDAGYEQLRRLFDYLKYAGLVGSGIQDEICIVDADDLLESPVETVRAFCASIGLPFDPASLSWGTEKDQQRARDLFKNWAPFHDAVLKSTSLIPRLRKTTSSAEDMTKWIRKFGQKAANLIQKNVDENMPHYLYLRQFAIKPATEH